MRSRRRHEESSHINKERWLITYADMITLLMIFFIVMYTMSKVDVDKFKSLAESLAAAMGAGGVILESPGPALVPGQPPGDAEVEEQVRLEEIKKQLEELIKNAGLELKMSVTTEERGLVLTFQEDVLFDLGSAELRPEARGIIRKVGSVLLKSPNYIRVEGHTDDLPIHNDKYPSNWELSAARATNVVREMIRSLGFPPQRLSAVAYGEYRPRVPNTSDANRQLNRRVDIVVLRSTYEESEPGASPIGIRALEKEVGRAAKKE